ncbi:MAG: hypothetical protein IKX80_03740 [Lachnospiraceae bacterium]|nr:hypothetical protein [Lachnospiraceae bacterium]
MPIDMETIDNVFQLLVSGGCTVIAINRAISTGKRPWTMLAVCFSASLLADLYWQLIYAFSGHTAMVFYVADTGWYVASLFLYIFMKEIALDRPGEKSIFIWPVPVFAAGMGIFYMHYGDYISNIVAAVVMSLLGCETVKGLHTVRRRERANEIDQTDAKHYRRLHISILACFIMIYGMWTASCFFKENTVTNPYYWCDILMSAARLFILAFAFPVIGSSEKKDTARV